MELELREYDNSDRVAVGRFIAESTGNELLGDRAVEVLERVITGRDKVCQIFERENLVAVGILIDGCDSQFNAAELSAVVRNDSPILMSLLLSWALPLVRSGPREAIDLPEFPGVKFDSRWLRDNGFVPAYRMWEMECREVGARAVVLPEGLRWKNYDDAHLEALYRLLKSTFLEIPGAFIMPKEAVAERWRSMPIHPQLLFKGDELLGFTRVGMLTPNRGEVGMIGRHAAWKGKGLGPLLLSHGIDVLRKNGAESIQLEVAATNDRALSLYRKFGFVPISSMQVFQRKQLG